MTTPEALVGDVQRLNAQSHLHLIGECIWVSPDFRVATMELRPEYSGSNIVLKDCLIMHERMGWAHVAVSSISVRRYLQEADGSLTLGSNGEPIPDPEHPGEIGLITALGGIEGVKVVQFGIGFGRDWLRVHEQSLNLERVSRTNQRPGHFRSVVSHQDYYQRVDDDVRIPYEYTDIINGVQGSGLQMYTRQRPDGLMLGTAAITPGDGPAASELGKTPGELVETPLPVLNRDDLTSQDGFDQIRNQRLMSNWSGTRLSTVTIRRAVGSSTTEQELEGFDSWQEDYTPNLPSGTTGVGFKFTPLYPDEVASIEVTLITFPSLTGRPVALTVNENVYSTPVLSLVKSTQVVRVKINVNRTIAGYYAFTLRPN